MNGSLVFQVLDDSLRINAPSFYDPATGGPYGPQSVSTGDLTARIDFENTADSRFSGRLLLETAVSGGTYIASVPEPESLALTAAGLSWYWAHGPAARPRARTADTRWQR